LRTLVLLLLSASAHADLYRWVDPASGSVKFSNLPPDPGVNAQVVPYQGPVPPKSPAPSAASAKPPPLAPADASSVPALEAQFNVLYAQLASAPPQSYRNADNKLQGQMQAYEALRAELDRLDPAGAPRRSAATLALVERLKQALVIQK
jgi:Domain of unknown function (DUF4124)